MLCAGNREMEYRPIEVKLICAKDLKDVNVFSTMSVYVVGSVSGDPRNMQRTPVHKDGGINPEWKYEMRFAVDESAARMNRLGLVFQIMSERTLGDKEIGRVYVPLKELFDVNDQTSGEVSGDVGRLVTYQVQTSSGKFKGVLDFSFKFGEKFVQSLDWIRDEPVRTYPVLIGTGWRENCDVGLSSGPNVSQETGHGFPQQPFDPARSGPNGYPSQSQFDRGDPPSESASKLCTCGATRPEAAQ